MNQDILRESRSRERDNRFRCKECGRSYEWVPEKRFPWFEVGFIAIALLVIGAGLERWELKSNYHHFENVKVLKRYDAYRYQMRFPTGVQEVYFCQDYKPCIAEGSILTSLRYEDAGQCWEVKPDGLGYNPLLDKDGNNVDENGRIVFDAVKDSCN